MAILDVVQSIKAFTLEFTPILTGSKEPFGHKIASYRNIQEVLSVFFCPTLKLHNSIFDKLCKLQIKEIISDS